MKTLGPNHAQHIAARSFHSSGNQKRPSSVIALTPATATALNLRAKRELRAYVVDATSSGARLGATLLSLNATGGIRVHDHSPIWATPTRHPRNSPCASWCAPSARARAPRTRALKVPCHVFELSTMTRKQDVTLTVKTHLSQSKCTWVKTHINNNIMLITASCDTILQVILYQHGDFSGWQAEFKAGDYQYSAFIAKGARNDDASSIKVFDDTGT